MPSIINACIQFTSNVAALSGHQQMWYASFGLLFDNLLLHANDQ